MWRSASSLAERPSKSCAAERVSTSPRRRRACARGGGGGGGIAVARDRDGGDVDRALARRVLRMLATLELYATHFEPPLLAAAQRYFEADAARAAADVSLGDYVAHVDALLAGPHLRVCVCVCVCVCCDLLYLNASLSFPPHILAAAAATLPPRRRRSHPIA